MSAVHKKPASPIKDTASKELSTRLVKGAKQVVPGPYVREAPETLLVYGGPESVPHCWPAPLKYPPLSSMEMDPIWSSLLDNMIIEILGGKAAGRYVRWRVLPKIFESGHANRQTRDLVKQFLKDAKGRPHYPVYVEATQGGPFGSYILQFRDDARRFSALLVQLFGVHNAVPCRRCERLMSDKDYAGMHPFFPCRSLVGYGTTSCANCLFSVQPGECSFHPSKGDSGAYLRASPQTLAIPEDITEENSPSLLTIPPEQLKAMVKGKTKRRLRQKDQEFL